ncbi:restriction endonuclease subunit S [Eggerthella lenta]|uniref:restriction endonuclease subunit S n=1 Tax=Eggerthella lenta TaxID=84112 RepID=UPI000E439905|nr:restriction endonuclease subunit S [Eggerthella lenta]RGL81312.1 restriction endonuclease subunit S [Eggerthella lenta]
MAEKQNTPEIRFKGFTDPWEQRKLGGIAPVTMGQSPNGACYTDNPNDAVLVQGNADLKDGWVFPRVWTTEITKTAKAGDLIMSVRAPVGAMGKTAYDVVLGRGVAGIAGNEFLFQALSKKEAEGYWSTVSAGSTFDSINGDELRNTPVDYPRSKPEREAVGSCLSRIDCLITLHQRKHDKLCTVKRSMLDKMFPKPGETEPEIRFKGFTDPWEQRKLGDVAAVYDGVHQTPDYQDEGVMFLSVENIATLTSQKFISREAFAKDYPVYPKHGDVLMTRIGDIGTSNVVETDDKLAFYVSLALLKPFDVDSYYLDKSLQSPSAKEELYRRTLHIAFPKKINKNQIAEVMLPIPRSRQEQEQIGALFRDLDSLITLHQRKLDLLKNTKKSLLDKMFV